MTISQDVGMRPLRVLIVEDEFYISLHTRGLLQALGHVVVAVAVSAEQAVNIAERERPDVVLMDIRLMGSRDGIDAADEISDRFGIASIFVTANTDGETRRRAEAVQPLGFLGKAAHRTALTSGAQQSRPLKGHAKLGRHWHQAIDRCGREAKGHAPAMARPACNGPQTPGVLGARPCHRESLLALVSLRPFAPLPRARPELRPTGQSLQSLSKMGLLAKWAIAILLPSIDRIVAPRSAARGAHVVAYSRLDRDVGGDGSSCRLFRALRR